MLVVPIWILYTYDWQKIFITAFEICIYGLEVRALDVQLCWRKSNTYISKYIIYIDMLSHICQGRKDWKKSALKPKRASA